MAAPRTALHLVAPIRNLGASSIRGLSSAVTPEGHQRKGRMLLQHLTDRFYDVEALREYVFQKQVSKVHKENRSKQKTSVSSQSAVLPRKPQPVSVSPFPAHPQSRSLGATSGTLVTGMSSPIVHENHLWNLEVIHSPICQSNRELEAANGQSFLEEPHLPTARGCLQESPGRPGACCDRSSGQMTQPDTPLTKKGFRVNSGG